MNSRPTRSRLQDFLEALAGKPCWYVSCGGRAGSSFKLCVGAKLRREKPLPGSLHPKAFRENEPEYCLLVWCDWRLSRKGSVVVTSDDVENERKWAELLRPLRGSTVSKLEVASDFGDLRIRFDRGRLLDVFCDFGKKAPSLDTNWELFDTRSRLAKA